MTSERFWGLVLGNLGVFDGVPAELQMVLDGGNVRNGRYNGWIPLALGLLLFTDPIVVLLLMFNTSTVFSAQRYTTLLVPRPVEARARRGRADPPPPAPHQATSIILP